MEKVWKKEHGQSSGEIYRAHDKKMTYQFERQVIEHDKGQSFIECDSDPEVNAVRFSQEFRDTLGQDLTPRELSKLIDTLSDLLVSDNKEQSKSRLESLIEVLEQKVSRL